MKHHELVNPGYFVHMCVASNLFLWRSLFAWVLFMTGNTWLGTVKRLKKLIGFWIDPLGHYSGYREEAGQAKQQLCQVGQRPAEGWASVFDKRHSNKTDCQVIWQGLDTHSLGRGECWTQAEVLRDPPVWGEKTGSAPKWGEWAHLLILTRCCTAAEGNEWHWGSPWRCDVVWPNLSSRAALSTTEMRTSENYSLGSVEALKI